MDAMLTQGENEGYLSSLNALKPTKKFDFLDAKKLKVSKITQSHI